MKRNRLVLFIAWVISIVIISFYGGPVSYGLFAMLTLVPIISLIYIFIVFISYKIFQKIETVSVVANHTVDYYFTLQNESPFLFSGIQVGFYSSFSEITGLDGKTEYELAPKNGIRIDTQLVCKYRGEYEVGVKHVIIQDPFRLFRFTFKNPEPFSTKVKPDSITINELKAGDRLVEMKRESMRNRNDMDVILREYVPGDPMKKINWKASARSGEILVRKDIGEEKGRLRIILDTFRWSGEPAVYLPIENKELELVLALSLYYVRKNIPVTLSYMQEGAVNLHLDSIGRYEDFYEQVSTIRFLEDYRPDELLASAGFDSEADSAIGTILVFHEWTESLSKAAAFLAEMGNSVDAYLVTDTEKEHPKGVARLREIVVPTNKDLEESL